MVKKKAIQKTSKASLDTIARSETPLDPIAWMTTAIERAGQTKTYCVSGTLPLMNPQLHVEGVGAIHLPLKPKQAKALVELGRLAPFGRGTKTLVDTRVRKTFEFDASQVGTSAEWKQMIDGVVAKVAEQLGLEDAKLTAMLYKLLLYERGGHFQKHRDSEKIKRMVGSLIVMLPTTFTGGALVVRHEGCRETYNFKEARHELASEFVAFYADCEHEVQRVTSGRRMCLAYNLVIEKSPRKTKTTTVVEGTERLSQSITSFVAKQPDQPLVFALEHQYTQAGLRADLLKGTDRALATLVEAAAKQTGCRVYLAQVERHLNQQADDGNWGSDRWSRRDRHSEKVDISSLNLGEVYEDDLNGSHWRDLAGKQQKFGVIQFAPNVIVSRIPLDDWKPTKEEYEGYTGNAGNTLDRWYHRSAIVLWHADHHFDVIVQGGIRPSIDMYFSMHAKLAKTPKKRLDEAREDCFRLARAIIHRWPTRYHHSRDTLKDDQPWLRQFILTLTEYDSKSLHESVLDAMLRDSVTPIREYVLAVSRQHGIDLIVPKIKELLASPLSKRNQELYPRDIACLQTLCCDRKIAGDNKQLAELCELTAQRFCEAENQKSGSYHGTEVAAAKIETLELLLQSCLAIRADRLAAKLIDQVLGQPERFTNEHAQVPCLLKLIPWSLKRLKEIPPSLARWRDEVTKELAAAIAVSPSKPADWTRPAEIEVSSPFDRQLNEFLADPEAETLTIPAAENQRAQIISTVRRYGCDLSHRLEKKGSPHRLVFTKTLGSWERAVAQYETNIKLHTQVTK